MVSDFTEMLAEQFLSPVVFRQEAGDTKTWLTWMVSFDNDWLFTRKETNLFIAAFWTEANGVVLFERLFIYSFIN